MSYGGIIVLAGPSWRACMVGLVGLALVMLGGCRRDLDIPPMEVKVVEAYGVKLDAAASPKQVVYVLLRSLRDDVEASQAWDKAKKKRAFQTSFALAAFQAMSRRLMDNPAILTARKGGEADVAARHIYDAVDHWAPIVGHYIRSFEADEQAAMTKMTEVLAADGRTGRVYVDVAHDSQEEDPAKAQSVTLVIEMAREKGVDGSEYWRVLKLGYQPRTKVITVSEPSRG